MIFGGRNRENKKVFSTILDTIFPPWYNLNVRNHRSFLWANQTKKTAYHPEDRRKDNGGAPPGNRDDRTNLPTVWASLTKAVG